MSAFVINSYAHVINPLSLSPALWLSDTGTSAGTWPDLSGNGRDATQATAANQPAIITNALNGRQVRRFDGNDFMLSGTTSTWNFLHNGTTASVFIVARAGDSSNPNAVYTFLSTGGEATAAIGYWLAYDDRDFIPRNNSIVNVISRGVTGAAAVIADNQNAFTPNQAGLIFNEVDADNATAANRSVVRVNGGSEIKGNALTNAPSASNSTYAMTVGAFLGGTSGFLVGDMAEVLIFPAALSNTERESVQNYLNGKWAVY